MKIVATNPGHDGHVCFIEGGRLRFSYESEKDNNHRYSELSATNLLDALDVIGEQVDVIATAGWARGDDPRNPITGAGYRGPNVWTSGQMAVLGQTVRTFSSSHERSHIMCAYALSPWPQGTECYALIWEGVIGSFYHISANLEITEIGEALSEPGIRYGFLFGVGDPTFKFPRGSVRLGDAGKLMALAATGSAGACTDAERQVVDYIMSQSAALDTLWKEDLRDSPLYNAGVNTESFVNTARLLSETIYATFRKFAHKNMKPGLPLLVAGGCGLNCDWNTAWKSDGFFSDIFIPPCTNDTGVAIGTAADAQFYYTGKAKLEWSVYTGQPFIHDVLEPIGYTVHQIDWNRLANFLYGENVIGWVQGNCEIGPRALGHRSILASPFNPRMITKLNGIKQRESYRPIAPICLLSEAQRCFNWQGESPFMLHFQTVATTKLGAVTHADGSARIQTVDDSSDEEITNLLAAFKERTDYGVLCNTSLNFKGRGFINRTSDLVEYADKHGLDGFVIGSQLYVKSSSAY